MQGCITSRDVLRHPVIICQLWGLGCYVRCLHALLTRRRCTFLQLAVANRSRCAARVDG
jgi:hypothetical protein